MDTKEQHILHAAQTANYAMESTNSSVAGIRVFINGLSGHPETDKLMSYYVMAHASSLSMSHDQVRRWMNYFSDTELFTGQEYRPRVERFTPDDFTLLFNMNWQVAQGFTTIEVDISALPDMSRYGYHKQRNEIITEIGRDLIKSLGIYPTD